MHPQEGVPVRRALHLAHQAPLPTPLATVLTTELISLPAAFTAVTGAAHWQVLTRARAIETQCYVLAAGQGGSHPGGRETFGHSAIINPWGRVLAEQASGQAVLVAARDAAEQAAIRRRMPVARHTRFFATAEPRLPGVEQS
mgnify:CR=1 FL=1